ncbi:hypothetical protein E6C60_0453 [Paenibacillus algicola]|uniref:Uncharacterized protein n=1 Tax=Paenibacillus algicola TaxID=2565926 RepID=A0A4P8XFL1_9BACL|nr:hypothetical protein E6C60_0453 [Paenibacillus algicola]
MLAGRINQIYFYVQTFERALKIIEALICFYFAACPAGSLLISRAVSA